MPRGFIVDFSLTADNTLQIFELGDLKNSTTEGYDTLHPDCTVAEKIRNTLKADMGNNVFTISKAARKVIVSSFNPKIQDLLNQQSNFSFDFLPAKKKFYGLLTACAASEGDNKLILESVNRKCERTFSGGEKTEAFFSWVNQYPLALPSLQLRELSPTFYEVCHNKQKLHQYLKKSPIYPKTFIGRSITDTLIAGKLQLFLDKTAATHYVLKPTTQSCGRGVVVLERDEVKSYIETISKNLCDNPFWKQCPNIPFLLQVCTPSKPLPISEDKMYRPTGRLVFLLSNKPQDSSLPYIFMGAYWKLPEMPIDNAAAFSTKNTVSCINSQIRPSTVPISAEINGSDLTRILEQFDRYFPAIYQKIQVDDCNQYSDQYSQISRDIQKMQKSPADRAHAIVTFVSTLSGHRTDCAKCSILAMIYAGLANIFSEELMSGYPLDSLARAIVFFWKEGVTPTTRAIFEKKISGTQLDLVITGCVSVEQLSQYQPEKMDLMLEGLACGFPRKIVMRGDFSREWIYCVKEQKISVQQVLEEKLSRIESYRLGGTLFARLNQGAQSPQSDYSKQCGIS